MRYWKHPDGRLEAHSNAKNIPPGFEEIEAVQFQAEIAAMPAPPKSPAPRDIAAELDALRAELVDKGIIEN